ncbi:MAG: hypothetical protein ACR2NR_10155 [Solirubrobacteraceae bacterium]
MATVAEALHRPVAIAIPALGKPVLSPPEALGAGVTATIAAHADAVIAGRDRTMPEVIAEAVPVQIGEQIVGIVVAAGPGPTPPGNALEQRAWLQAAAAAASVTALIRETHGAGAAAAGSDSAQDLLIELSAAAPGDLPAFLARARRLGHELSTGAVAICAWSPTEDGRESERLARQLAAELPGLVATLRAGRLLVLAPLPRRRRGGATERATAGARAGGVRVNAATRPGPAASGGDRAELLADLGTPETVSGTQDETYRLLIGVLQRDREDSSSGATARSRRWPTTTPGTTPSCWPRCAPSSPTTVRRPRRPR